MNDYINLAPHSSMRSHAFVELVTPSDIADLARPCRAIRCAGAGNVALVPVGNDEDDNTPVVCAFLAGETRNIAARRIMSTGTTATGIEAML